jgi:hypothetical protein
LAKASSAEYATCTIWEADWCFRYCCRSVLTLSLVSKCQETQMVCR